MIDLWKNAYLNFNYLFVLIYNFEWSFILSYPFGRSRSLNMFSNQFKFINTKRYIFTNIFDKIKEITRFLFFSIQTYSQ